MSKKRQEAKKQVKDKRDRAQKFLERFGLKDEKRFFKVGKILIVVALSLISVLIVAQLISTHPKKIGRIIGVCIAISLLLYSEVFNLFFTKKMPIKVCFYVITFLCIFGLMAVTEATYLTIVYMIVLTEFYLSARKVRVSTLIFSISMPLYLLAYALSAVVMKSFNIAAFSHGFVSMALMSIHFVVMTFLISFYRQYLQLIQLTQDLDESTIRLKEAYDDLAEVTALEERQRIAKDIHDTAGHSITTVIMQTEAAKLIVEQDPTTAKQKIVAANLQAKHALEKLRESVHLLSGSLGKPTLKTALLEIIAESTDGTDVAIRHAVDDIGVGDNQYRFLCNSLREGISNGLRHGGATAFYFELKHVEDKLEFLLSDNGEGQKEEDLQQGFGLSGMTREAHSLGGTVSFYTEPGEGFEIRITLPAETTASGEKGEQV